VDAVARFSFSAEESKFRRADMQFMLELEAELNWNATGTLPAFRDLQLDSWLHTVDAEARLVITFSSFVSASLFTGFEAEPGTNLFVPIPPFATCSTCSRRPSRTWTSACALCCLSPTPSTKVSPISTLPPMTSSWVVSRSTPPIYALSCPASALRLVVVVVVVFVRL
jgi:hypothetical protein